MASIACGIWLYAIYMECGCTLFACRKIPDSLATPGHRVCARPHRKFARDGKSVLVRASSALCGQLLAAGLIQGSGYLP